MKKDDPYSMNVEGSPAEEMGESAAQERQEQLSEHELDNHHKTLMDAEKIKSNPHIMKQLQPHMAMKANLMKKVMGAPTGAPAKITSLDGIRAKAKSLA